MIDEFTLVHELDCEFYKWFFVCVYKKITILAK